MKKETNNVGNWLLITIGLIIIISFVRQGIRAAAMVITIINPAQYGDMDPSVV